MYEAVSWFVLERAGLFNWGEIDTSHRQLNFTAGGLRSKMTRLKQMYVLVLKPMRCYFGRDKSLTTPNRPR